MRQEEEDKYGRGGGEVRGRRGELEREGGREEGEVKRSAITEKRAYIQP